MEYTLQTLLLDNTLRSEDITDVVTQNIKERFKKSLSDCKRNNGFLQICVAFWSIAKNYFGEDLVEVLKREKSLVCVDIHEPTDIEKLNLISVAGVENLYIFLYQREKNCPSPPLLHSKVFLFDFGNNDAEIWIGSQNMTKAAFEDNLEATIILRTKSGSSLYKAVHKYISGVQYVCTRIEYGGKFLSKESGENGLYRQLQRCKEPKLEKEKVLEFWCDDSGLIQPKKSLTLLSLNIVGNCKDVFNTQAVNSGNKKAERIILKVHDESGKLAIFESKAAIKGTNLHEVKINPRLLGYILRANCSPPFMFPKSDINMEGFIKRIQDWQEKNKSDNSFVEISFDIVKQCNEVQTQDVKIPMWGWAGNDEQLQQILNNYGLTKATHSPKRSEPPHQSSIPLEGVFGESGLKNYYKRIINSDNLTDDLLKLSSHGIQHKLIEEQGISNDCSSHKAHDLFKSEQA